MTIKTRFPSIEPSLDLNFAATKRLDPRITFTRASSATFVNENGLIEAAGVNQARFDHTPTTGESLGCWWRRQRTNSFAWSNSATQGETWNSVGVQLNLASGQSDPAGGTAGIRATDANSFSGGTSLQRTNLANLTASTTVTYSIWLKPIDCPDNLINLIIFANTTTDSINAVFSVSGTAITAVSTSASGTGVASGASFEVFPNGWYRCRLTGVPSTVTMADVRARISLGSYQRAAGTARFDWYGAQFESGAFTTSYIPTSGTAATRAADVASITGSNFSSWYRQDEGTFFWSGSMYDTQYSNQNSFRVTEGSNFRGIGIALDGRTGTDEASFVTRSGAGITAATSSIPYVIGNSNIRIGGAFGTDIAASFNGSTPFVASPAYVFGTENKMEIMGDKTTGGTNYQYNGHTRRLTFWPTRLSNEVLQRITQ
jgi:hypothetical protein